MNTHQPIFLTTTIIVPNVYVLGTQAMNLGMGHIVIFINYQTT